MYSMRLPLYPFRGTRSVVEIWERKPTHAFALLIQVLSHAWRLFITCDNLAKDYTIGQDFITACGPIPIGPIIGMVEVYQLVAALKIIKVWSESAFIHHLERWFCCDERRAGSIV
jgi:hypothetical protein